jgi:hypothetical protein
MADPAQTRSLLISSPGVEHAWKAGASSYAGHDEILRFHGWMLKFAPDSVIEFSAPAAQDGRLYLEWLWSGSFAGPLKLRDGRLVPATGAKFGIVGVGACRYREDGKLTSHRDFWDASEFLEHVAPMTSSASGR